MSLVELHHDTELSTCEEYTDCIEIDFDNIASGIDGDDGFLKKLLNESYDFIGRAIGDGLLSEAAAGQAVGSIISSAIQNAITFELGKAKAEKDAQLVQLNIKKTILEMRIAEDRLTLDEHLNTAKIKDMEDKNRNTERATDADIRLRDAQIKEIECKCDIDRKKSDSDIAVSSKNIEMMDAQRAKNEAETKTINSKRGDEVLLLQEQQQKLKCDCANSTRETTADVSLKSQQTILASRQSLKTNAETDTIVSKEDAAVDLIRAQAERYRCECVNQRMTAEAQPKLANRQQAGFDDHMAIEFYKSKMQAWTMVFEDAGLEQVTPSLTDVSINEADDFVSKRLNGTMDENGVFHQGTASPANKCAKGSCPPKSH